MFLKAEVYSIRQERLRQKDGLTITDETSRFDIQLCVIPR